MFAFTKVFLAVLAVASSVCATITIDPPSIIGNATNTIKWSSTDIEGDPPVFSIELINVIFNSQFALANNVQTTQGSITFELPVVAAGDGYSIEFVGIGDINNVIAKTGDFAVQQHDADAPLPSTASAPAPKPTSTATLRSSTTSRSTVTQSSSTTSASSTISAVTITPSLTTSASSTVASSGASSGAASPSPSSGATGIVPAGALAAFVAGALALAL